MSARMVTRRKPVRKVTCTVCRHPERHRIEFLRLAGSAVDNLADSFGLKRDSLYRHLKNHLTPDDRAAIMADVPLTELADRAAKEGVSLLDYFAIVRSTVMTQMLGAASVNDRGATANLAGKACDILSQIGRLTGEMLNSGAVTHITNNTAIFLTPAFNQLQRMLLERLTPHPEALQAVLAGLEELEASEAHGGPMKALAPVLEGCHAEAA